ncbi:MAG TPA: hypothetical protein VMI10_04075 [Terriglobales bacterium]|nr:hypothetical protein [Terriglobales bacterium]
MKNHAAAVFILSLAGLTGLANAQSGSTVIAEVPFNYIANGRHMPAGETRVKIENNGQTYLWIAAESRSAFAMPVPNDSMKPSEETKLVFHRYGDRYFLAGVQREGQTRSYELPAGSLEKELRASNVEEKDVTLVASLKMFGK